MIVNWHRWLHLYLTCTFKQFMTGSIGFWRITKFWVEVTFESPKFEVNSLEAKKISWFCSCFFRLNTNPIEHQVSALPSDFSTEFRYAMKASCTFPWAAKHRPSRYSPAPDSGSAVTARWRHQMAARARAAGSPRDAHRWYSQPINGYIDCW